MYLINSKYEAVIGLEIHAQLNTASKIFSTDQNSFGDQPNTNVSVVSLGHPGAMPRLNRAAVEKAIVMGLACKSAITRFGYFDRKNYFYPDLPKGYQVTQDKTPICVGGQIPIPQCDTQEFVQLNRIHLEEDAGKSIHIQGGHESQIDLNRAGVPLIEIVTEPCIFSSSAAGEALSEVRKLVRHLNVSDGNMEEGSLRCDANVSVRLKGAEKLGKKVEVKNMNSIKHVMKAIDFEITRQIELIEDGKSVISETRTFDIEKAKTFGMRTKEELNDYRYFPEPDLSPLQITEKWLQEIQAGMPALPNELREKFINTYGLKKEAALTLSEDQFTAQYFEEICKGTKSYKKAANWVLGAIRSYLNENRSSIEDFPVKPSQIGELVDLIESGKLSSTLAAQELFPALIKEPSTTPSALMNELGLSHDSDSDSILEVIEEVLSADPDKVKEYKNGKKGLLGMFMGEVMKKTKGKVDPKVANKLMLETLESSK